VDKLGGNASFSSRVGWGLFLFVGHPPTQGRVLATRAQCKHCIPLVGLKPDLVAPEHNIEGGTYNA